MRIFLFSLLILLSSQVFSQADLVVGYWLTQDNDSQVQIYKSPDNKYFGSICWLKTPIEDGKPKVDKKNPDPRLKSRPIKDLLLLSGFKYEDRKKQWTDGTIYDPKSGNTYDCNMWFGKDNPNVLHVKGYVGFSLLGRKVAWKREASLRK